MCSGVTLQKGKSSAEPSPPKLTRTDVPSDDEVEVVTEWPPPPALESRSTLLEPPQPTSPPLHVPVIQSPAEAPPPDRDQVPVLLYFYSVLLHSPSTYTVVEVSNK